MLPFQTYLSERRLLVRITSDAGYTRGPWVNLPLHLSILLLEVMCNKQATARKNIVLDVPSWPVLSSYCLYSVKLSLIEVKKFFTAKQFLNNHSLCRKLSGSNKSAEETEISLRLLQQRLHIRSNCDCLRTLQIPAIFSR